MRYPANKKCHTDAKAIANADSNGIGTKNNMSPSPSVGDINMPSMFYIYKI